MARQTVHRPPEADLLVGALDRSTFVDRIRKPLSIVIVGGCASAS